MTTEPDRRGNGSDNERISAVTLDESSIVRWNRDIEHERQVAIFDLIENNRFAPKSGANGPYHLHLSLEEGRLLLDIRTEADEPVETVRLPLRVFRRIIRDYFTVCESYFNAIKTASPSQIEAIDMGRRSLHDEGSQLLLERLSERVEVDLPTARRLFTLICVLTLRG